MSDIVERLIAVDEGTSTTIFGCGPREAANEIKSLRAELAQNRYALEIIAGRRQPVDNTLGNVEVARYALDAARKGEG